LAGSKKITVLMIFLIVTVTAFTQRSAGLSGREAFTIELHTFRVSAVTGTVFRYFL